MDNHTLVAIISAILMLGGIAGSILPFLPGPPLGLAGLLLYAIVTKFQTVSVAAIIIFGALTILTIVLDVAAPALGAKGKKASRQGVWGSIIGGIAGMFVMGPFGIVIGPFVGAFIGEYLNKPNSEQALRAAWGSFLGFLVGTLARTAVAIAMGVYFLYAIFR